QCTWCSSGRGSVDASRRMIPLDSKVPSTSAELTTWSHGGPAIAPIRRQHGRVPRWWLALQWGACRQDHDARDRCITPEHVARAGIGRVGVRAGRMLVAGGGPAGAWVAEA